MPDDVRILLLLLFLWAPAHSKEQENFLLALHKTGSVLTEAVAADVSKEKDSGFTLCKQKTSKTAACNLGQFSNYKVTHLAKPSPRAGRSVVLVRDPATQVSLYF